MKNLLFILVLMSFISCKNQTEEKTNSSSSYKRSIEQERDKSNQQDYSDNKINVEIDIKHKIKNDGLFFEIATNLPNNFLGNMTITNDQGKIMGQSKFIVNNGIIKSDKFTIQGNPYPIGQYKLSISSPYPHLQEDEKVKNIIGKTGQNLIGENIERRTDDIFNEEYSFLNVDYDFNVSKQKLNNDIIGKYILKKGGGHNTTYIIKQKGEKFYLTTTVNSPNMSEFTTSDELIKKDNMYVRKSEMENPSYRFLIDKNKLKIYDSMGVYADLDNENN